MLFTNKQKKIESQLENYCHQVTLCIQGMCTAFRDYNATGDRLQLKENFTFVRKCEGTADDIRREIEVMMYSKALFPESRGDILRLVEAMDKVPNQAEAAVSMLLTHHIVIPEAFQDDILELAHTCKRCVDALLESVEKLFSDFTNATIAVGKVDELESKADHIEQNLTERIFSSDIDGVEKILLRDLIEAMGTVSDRAENAGDRIRIYVAKRSH
ncbi:TIGR00153 family protein [Oligoflexia bacterium]|nr:TIGR00153 family protein [Oligoflexia bacterium]